MLKIISSPGWAFANIFNFASAVESSPELQARLAYARAWYALQDKEGCWCFAPSKFAGYEGIDAKTYLENAEQSDGRRTEAELQLYFAVVDRTAPLYEELRSALFAFLAKFGKAPSKKIRINVIRERLVPSTDASSAEEANDAVVNLMIAVARTLPAKHFQNLQDQLEEIWA
jgi:hypothetical protein